MERVCRYPMQEAVRAEAPEQNSTSIMVKSECCALRPSSHLLPLACNQREANCCEYYPYTNARECAKGESNPGSSPVMEVVRDRGIEKLLLSLRRLSVRILSITEQRKSTITSLCSSLKSWEKAHIISNTKCNSPCVCRAYTKILKKLSANVTRMQNMLSFCTMSHSNLGFISTNGLNHECILFVEKTEFCMEQIKELRPLVGVENCKVRYI